MGNSIDESVLYEELIEGLKDVRAAADKIRVYGNDDGFVSSCHDIVNKNYLDYIFSVGSYEGLVDFAVKKFPDCGFEDYSLFSRGMSCFGDKGLAEEFGVVDIKVAHYILPALNDIMEKYHKR